jgi:biopolymer transport protein ExbD
VRLPYTVKKKARIEIIPMIDTMFFLLVFFMIATLSMTIQKGMQVTLPTAGSSTNHILEQVSLTLTKKGELFFNKEPIGILELEPRLQSLLLNGQKISVVINADESATHGRVVEIMDAVRKTGILNMAIATKPKSR